MKLTHSLVTLLAMSLPAAADTPAAAGKKAPDAKAPDAKADKAPAPPALPTPAKELDAVKPYIKTWSCSGMNPAGEKTSVKLTFKRDLGNFWVAVRFDEAKTKSRPAFVGVAMLGIDPIAKTWVLEGNDSMGGTIHLHAATAAVTADAMAWEGDSVDDGKKAPAKFNFSIDAKTKHLKFVGEFGGVKAIDLDCN
jgi:hypothetical protein